MLRATAQVISVVFHPLLMPTYLVGIILLLAPTVIQPAQLRYYLIALIFGMTGLLPALNLFFLKSVGAIASLYMPTRQSRVWPFLFIFIMYTLVTIMFYLKMPIPFMFNIMVISTALAALVCMATFVIKISVHAVVAAGFAGILLNLANIGAFDTLMVPALIAIVLAGLVMSSRLLLNAHTLSEVGWGGVLGFTVGYIGVTLLF
jgi:membrane-associated phospholipid phosphatase